MTWEPIVGSCAYLFVPALRNSFVNCTLWRVANFGGSVVKRVWKVGVWTSRAWNLKHAVKSGSVAPPTANNTISRPPRSDSRRITRTRYKTSPYLTALINPALPKLVSFLTGFSTHVFKRQKECLTGVRPWNTSLCQWTAIYHPQRKATHTYL